MKVFCTLRRRTHPFMCVSQVTITYYYVECYNGPPSNSEDVIFCHPSSNGTSSSLYHFHQNPKMAERESTQQETQAFNIAYKNALTRRYLEQSGEAQVRNQVIHDIEEGANKEDPIDKCIISFMEDKVEKWGVEIPSKVDMERTLGIEIDLQRALLLHLDLLNWCREALYKFDSTIVTEYTNFCEDQYPRLKMTEVLKDLEQLDNLDLRNAKRTSQLRNSWWIVLKRNHASKQDQEKWKSIINSWMDDNKPFDDCKREILEKHPRLQRQLDGELKNRKEFDKLPQLFHLLRTTRFKIREHRCLIQILDLYHGMLNQIPQLKWIPRLTELFLRSNELYFIHQDLQSINAFYGVTDILTRPLHELVVEKLEDETINNVAEGLGHLNL